MVQTSLFSNLLKFINPLSADWDYNHPAGRAYIDQHLQLIEYLQA